MKNPLLDTITETIRAIPKRDGTNASPIAAVTEPRYDGLVNALMGMGTSLDRTANNRWQVGQGLCLQDDVLTDMFRHDDLTRRLVTIFPKEATRQGFRVMLEDKSLEEKINDETGDLVRLDVKHQVFHAATWGRLYGGAIIVGGFRDGLDPSLPVKNFDSLDWLKVVDRRWVQKSAIVNDVRDPLFGKPAAYQFRSQGQYVNVHPSRVIEFPGVMTPDDIKEQNAGWDDNAVEVAFRVILDFAMGFGATSIMLSEANQAVVAIQGLIDKLAEDKQDDIVKRLQLMNISRGVARMLVLDAEGERYENHEIGFGGVALVLDRLMQRLSAAFELPVTILMGRSPAGMNATGDADFQAFYDNVNSYRGDVIQPRERKLVEWIMGAKQGPTGGVIPPKWSIKQNSLWQMTPHQQADLELKQAQRDALYIDREVYYPEEVARGRESEEGKVVIDESIRTAAQAEAKAQEAELAAQQAEQAKALGAQQKKEPVAEK